jgi:hypothetical protein
VRSLKPNIPSASHLRKSARTVPHDCRTGAIYRLSGDMDREAAKQQSRNVIMPRYNIE